MNDRSGSRPSAAVFPVVPRHVRGYDREAVDLFLVRARTAFDNPTTRERMTAADVRATTFRVQRGGYRPEAVDAALVRLEDAFAARERDAAVQTEGVRMWIGRTRGRAQEILDLLDRPARHRFRRVGPWQRGYRIDEVDIVATRLVGFLSSGEQVRASQVRGVGFRQQRRGYRQDDVDAVLDAVVEVMQAVR